MAVLNTGLAKTSAGGYTIDYSCRFEDGDAAKLTWTPSGSGDSLTAWTFSCWYKRGNLGGIQGIFGVDGNSDTIDYDANGSISFYSYSGGYVGKIQTSAAYYRDPTAWYNLVCVWDTGNATSGDRIRAYINGVRITSWGATTEPAEDAASAVINTATEHHIGKRLSSSQYFDGYLAEMQFIDGAALTPASFGETGDYGEWKPIKYTGSYGTNGFHLDFADSAALGNDVSGNDNDWTVTNLVASDQMLDSPTNNFCTWNTAEPTPSGVFTEGNTHFQASAINTAGNVAGTIGFSGKFYWEVFSSSDNQYHTEKVGIAADGFALDGFIGGESTTWGYGSNGSSQYRWHANSGTLLGSKQIGDIQMIAVDTDAGKVWFGRNGTWEESGNPATGANAQFSNVPAVVRPATSVNSTELGTDGSLCNFGQDSSFAGNKTAQGNQDGNDIGDFYYTPPSGFLALCTANLPEPAVTPSEHFNIVLYTGNATTNVISLDGMTAADIWWDKYTAGTASNQIFDRVRGFDKVSFSNLTNAEQTVSGTAYSSGSGNITYTGVHNGNNGDGEENVIWAWKANGSGSANTVGDIDSTVSVNTDAGFSIVSYEGNATAGATVGHGLSSTPEMIILKDRDGATNWSVYHASNTSAPETDALALNTTDATSDYLWWNDTAPTNSLFSLGAISNTNASGNDFIAYCFHSVDGYSKVGSWVGNGNADGTFIYTGFRPAFVLTKRVDSTSNWNIFDNKRNTYNVTNLNLHPDNQAGQAADGGIIDILSNGFKARDTSALINADSGDYIFLAFAETPFKYSNAR